MFEEEYSLNEVADMCGLSMNEAVLEVCHCDLLYGKICNYHKNPNMKCTLSEWQKMSVEADQYGVSKFTRLIPEQNQKLVLIQK